MFHNRATCLPSSPTHGEVASLVGSSRVTATRALHKLRDEVYLALRYSTIGLTDKLLARTDIFEDAHSDFFTIEESLKRQSF